MLACNLEDMKGSRCYWSANTIDHSNKRRNKHEEDDCYFGFRLALCIDGVCVQYNGDQPPDSLLQIRAKTGFPETPQKGTVYDL